MKNNKFELTSKILKNTLTFSAVLLTLTGPVLPLAAQATETEEISVSDDTARTPEVGTPEVGTPEVGTPEVGTPEVGAPETGEPDAVDIITKTSLEGSMVPYSPGAVGTGVLDLIYDFSQTGGSQWLEHSWLSIEVPANFAEIVNLPGAVNYMSGKGTMNNRLGTSRVTHILKGSDVSISDGGKKIKLSYPVSSFTALGNEKRTFKFDFGSLLKANGINTTLPGPYHFSAYKTQDSILNIVNSRYSSWNYAGNSGPVKPNSKPVISGSDKYIMVGDNFDPKTGITARDEKDGDITSKIQVTNNTVNTNRPGSYYVMYSVTNSAGIEGTLVVNVHVSAKPEKAPSPVVNPVTEGDRTIKGTAMPGATISVILPDDTEITMTADQNGDFSVPITDVYERDMITVTQNKEGYLESNPTKIRVQAKVEKAEAPQVNPVLSGENSISGLALPNAVVTAKDTNGKIIGSTNAESTGKYTIYMAPAVVGQVINVVQKTDKKIESDPTSITVTSKPQQADAPAVNSVTEGDQSVTGTALPNAEVAVQLSNGKVIKVVADEQGKFEAYIPTAVKGDVLSITQKTENTLESNATKVTVKEKETQIIEETTINGLTTDSTQAVGTAEPNSTIVIKVNGTEIGKGRVGSDGKYSITIPKQNAGTQVTATATANGKELSATTTVTQGNIKETTIDGLTTDSTQAVGTAEPNSTIVIKVNGTEIGKGTVGSDGKYSITIPKQNAGTQVTATATASGKESSATTTVTQGTVETQGVITPSEFTIGDTNIVGTYTGDVSKARVTINGKEQAWGGSFSNGKFTYYVGAGKIKAGDIVTITAYDKNDKVLDANKPVTIKTVSAGTITPAEYTIGDTEITGSYTGDVSKARVTINGKVQAWGGSFNNGKFTYYVGNGKIKAGDVVTITAYDKEDKVLDADKVVKIKNIVQGTISPVAYHVGETTIKGTYTGAIVKARVLINGEPQAWGGTFSGGNFTYYVGAGKIKVGDDVKIVGYSEDNSELTTQTVTVQK